MVNRVSKITVALVGLLVLLRVSDTHPTLAQDAARTESKLESALNKFLSDQNFQADITWRDKIRSPQSIHNIRANVGGGTPEAIARRFLSEYNDLFLMTKDNTDLQLDEIQESLASYHVRFQQTYREIPVYRGVVSVHMTKKGEIQVVNNNYEPDVYVYTVPRITKDQAIEKAKKVLDFELLRGEIISELVIYPHDSKCFLAWRLLIPATVPLGDWELLIDAISGDVLSQENLLRFAEGRGRVFNPNAVVALRDNNLRDPLARDTGTQPTTPEQNCDPNVVPTAGYSDVILRGLDGSGMLTGEFVNTSTTPNRVAAPDLNFSYLRCTGGFLEAMVYFHIDSMQRYIQSLGFNNANNRSINVNAHGFIPSPSRTQDQSFYSPITKSLTFGLGGIADAEDGEIISHEYGHAIQDNQVPGFGFVPGFGLGGEAGAMGEGFGDYWAASFQANASGGFQDECVGEWDATFYSRSIPPCLRRVDGTKRYPTNIVGEVHLDGEIWSATLWEIRAALGAQTTDRLVLESHFMLSTNPMFRDGVNAILTADQNLNGGQNAAIIRQAFVRRGILEPATEAKLFFPLFFNGHLSSPLTLNDSYATGLAFVNPSGQTANLTLTAYDFSGAVISGPGITNPARQTVGPNGQRALFAYEIFGFTNPRRGWIEVSSDVRSVKGFFLIMDSSFSRVVDGTDVSSATSQSLILMHREADETQGLTTIYALCNPNSVPAQVVVTFYNPDGSLSSSSTTIAAKGMYVVPEPVGSLRGGYVGVSSTQPITGLEIFGNMDWIAALKAVPTGNQAAELFFPHFTVNGGFTTDIAIINPTASAANLRITAHRNDGSEIGSIDRRLDAAQQLLESVGSAFRISGSNLEVGYLRVQSSVAGLLGYTNFNYINQADAAVPVALTPSTNLTFSHIGHGVRTGSGSSYITGVAMVNPSDSQTANYTISVFNPSGERVAQREGLTLGPRQKVSLLLHEFFQSPLPVLAGGYVTVNSTVGLFGFEVFLTDNVDRLSAVPSQ